MSVTANKKKNFKAVLELLTEKYDAYSIDIDGFYTQLNIKHAGFELAFELTRNCDFNSWDSIKLAGHGWSEEEIAKQEAAFKLEKEIRTLIKEIKKSGK
tara:strand:+ start:649 stop:945 length:297 start_codon:yes stop_codon:yes gene_type:complete